MRKNIFAAFGIIVFSIAAFASCKKSNDSKPDNDSGTGGSKITGQDSVALGYWFGSFDNGAYNQSMIFTGNGVVKVYDFYYYPTSTDTTIAYDGTGYWSVSGNLLTIVDSFPNGEKFTSVNTLNLTANPETYTDNSTGDVYKKQ